jgi:hypothetical protein
MAAATPRESNPVNELLTQHLLRFIPPFPFEEPGLYP